MEEIVLRWIERVGFPIFASVASSGVLGYVVYRLFLMYMNALQSRLEESQQHAKNLEQVSHGTNIALGHNTLATKELTDTLKKAFGNDPATVCKAAEMAKDAKDKGFKCEAADIARVLELRKQNG